ncbi:SURF1 family protein [Microbispora sp. RL4-1S]|uniref:SURF1-like protein n=1 Tax=Microbispora oryzae TaxID=2806554 RepID=A0A940WL59_9ACTN|nr:SURF1 family protein [Microbispora oryzae]MBP2705902.1 SURF1 family protein [Microbispora oryzae]
MLRTLFAPRLVALHLLVIGVLVSFTLLGRWQLGVFESSGKPRLLADPAPVAVATLAQVGRHLDVGAMSRKVTADGVFDASRQLLVAGRAADAGSPEGTGFWLLTPLRLADGTVIPVVRGWVASPADPAAAVPDGSVTVTGRLEASEQGDDVARRGPLPDGQVATVSTAQLINLWPDTRVRDGFVVASTQAPPSAATPVTVPPPTEGVGFNWRNLAYAAQWWIFAAFAVVMWFHFVRESVRRDRAGDDADDADDPEPAAVIRT